MSACLKGPELLAADQMKAASSPAVELYRLETRTSSPGVELYRRETRASSPGVELYRLETRVDTNHLNGDRREVSEFSSLDRVSPRATSSGQGWNETSDLESSWDSKHGDKWSRTLDPVPRTSRTPRHKGEQNKPWSAQDKTRETFHSVPIRETGAIPKKRAAVPLPSPAHPDEIICLPLDDLTPPTTNTSGSGRNYFSYAH